MESGNMCLLPVLVIMILPPYVECACNWPSVFQGSTWKDNTRGDITFTTTTLSGWNFASYGSTISNWECLDAGDFTADGTLLLKATDTFSHIGSTWTSYLCLQMIEVAANSYYYYQKHPQQPNAAEERVKINDADTLTTRVQICGSDAIPTAEFHFMVKLGYESDSKQYCPPSLLARMDYSYTGSDTSTACQSSIDDWDVCTDRMIMTFDYTTCSQQMASSAAGEVWCMMNITSTYEYVVVYNTDTGGSAVKFSCFVVSTDGATASMVANNCTSNQTPTILAQSHDGTDIGALLTMTATETCPFLLPSSSDPESTSLIPIIVGAVVGVLAVIVIVAITVYCIKRKKSTVKHVDTGTKSATAVKDSGETVSVTDQEKPPISENPAISMQPGKHALTPLPNKPNGVAPTDLSPRPSDILPPISTTKT